MNFLERIDAIILSFFTKISHKFQRLTGRTNFFLAKIVIIILGISNTFWIFHIFIPITMVKMSPFVGVLVGVYWIYIISKDWNKLGQAENNSLNEAQAKIRFSLGGENWLNRIIWALTSILFSQSLINGIIFPKIHWIIEVVLHSFLFVCTAYIYLISVTPLPPGKSKVRQWLESFGKVLVPIPIKNKN